MQGISRADRDLWDADEVAGHLVPTGSVFAFLAGHRRELFPDCFTADQAMCWKAGCAGVAATVGGPLLDRLWDRQLNLTV